MTMGEFIAHTVDITVRLGYKNQSVSAVYGNNRCFSEMHTKHIHTLSGQKVELVNVKLVVHTVSNHWALVG